MILCSSAVTAQPVFCIEAYSFYIQWLDGMNIYQLNADAFFFQDLCRFHCFPYHVAAGKNAYISPSFMQCALPI